MVSITLSQFTWTIKYPGKCLWNINKQYIFIFVLQKINTYFDVCIVKLLVINTYLSINVFIFRIFFKQ